MEKTNETRIVTIAEARVRLTHHKQKHKNCFFLAVPIDEEEIGDDAPHEIVFVKYPTREKMAIIAPLLTRQALYDVAELVLDNIIEGDPELKNDVPFVNACMPVIEQVLLGRMAKLGKK